MQSSVPLVAPPGAPPFLPTSDCSRAAPLSERSGPRARAGACGAVGSSQDPGPTSASPRQGLTTSRARQLTRDHRWSGGRDLPLPHSPEVQSHSWPPRVRGCRLASSPTPPPPKWDASHRRGTTHRYPAPGRQTRTHKELPFGQRYLPPAGQARAAIPPV